MKRFTSRDLIAGVTNAVTNIPDAMASAVLAGLNPIQGLYAIMIGTPVSALTTSSQLMTVAVTGAMALIVGDSLAALSAAEKVEALIVLTVLVALTQVLLGLARAGTLVRFVSNAVLQGFLLGVAVNIVLSQVGGPHGLRQRRARQGRAERSTRFCIRDRSICSCWRIGLFTIAVVILVEKTPAKDFSFLVALVVSTVGALLLQWDVPTVQTLSEIPQALPTPSIPDLSLVAGLIVPGIAIAIVGLIQSAGVSKGTPNSDGTYPDMNRDFIGQGLGNAASGVFGGMPIGGSVSSTALCRAARREVADGQLPGRPDHRDRRPGLRGRGRDHPARHAGGPAGRHRSPGHQAPRHPDGLADERARRARSWRPPSSRC